MRTQEIKLSYILTPNMYWFSLFCPRRWCIALVTGITYRIKEEESFFRFCHSTRSLRTLYIPCNAIWAIPQKNQKKAIYAVK